MSAPLVKVFPMSVFDRSAITGTIWRNNTRQGYARKCTLKPAGYFFLAQARMGQV